MKSSVSGTAVLFSVLIFLPVLSGYSAQDTTYSDTRMTPRSGSRIPEKSDRNRYRKNYNGDEDEDCGCFCLLFKVILYECFGCMASEMYGLVGSPDPVNFSSSGGNLGIGLLDFTSYSSASLTNSINISGGVSYGLGDYFLFREKLVAAFSYDSEIYADFERDYYTDTVTGIQTDNIHTYTTHSLSLMSELLVRPFGRYGHFFISFGAGPRLVYEKMEGTRKNRVGNRVEEAPVSLTEWSIIPAFSIAAGRLFTKSASGYGSLEIRYTLGINRPSRTESLPSDNYKYLHNVSLLEFSLGW
ncbi:MAG: hypothetical protein ACOCXC_03970 [Fibrobacterota bacterium]